MAQTVDELISELEQQTENSTIETSAPAEQPAFDEHQEQPEQKTEPAAEEPVSKSSANEMAKFCVNMFSGLMKMLFVPLYKWSILEEGDIKKMREFRNKHKGQSEKQMEEALSNDSPMWPVVTRFDKYMEAVDGAALTDEEKDMIIDPLSNCIVHYNWKFSPGWMLALAVSFVILPRITRLIPSGGKTEEA